MRPSSMACANSNEKIAVTAAATMPRGAISDKKICSLRVTCREKRLAPKTASGRTTTMSITRRQIPGMRASRRASRATRPDNTMKSTEIINTLRFSLNSRMCFTETDFWLARAMPNTVQVSRPDSG